MKNIIFIFIALLFNNFINSQSQNLTYNLTTDIFTDDISSAKKDTKISINLTNYNPFVYEIDLQKKVNDNSSKIFPFFINTLSSLFSLNLTMAKNKISSLTVSDKTGFYSLYQDYLTLLKELKKQHMIVIKLTVCS